MYYPINIHYYCYPTIISLHTSPQMENLALLAIKSSNKLI